MSIYKTKLNPFTGELQLVYNGTIVTLLGGVNTQTDLPLIDNSKGDGRIANDTGHLYVWSIVASSGDLTDWIDQGDFIDIKWGALQDKPLSSVDDIDDAVDKKHGVNDLNSSHYTKGENDSLLVDKSDKHISINSQLNDYTLVLSDDSKLIDMNKATAIVLTVPKNSIVAFSIGTIVNIRQKGAGQITITPVDVDVTINSQDGLITTNQHAIASILKIDTDTWVAVGSLENS